MDHSCFQSCRSTNCNNVIDKSELLECIRIDSQDRDSSISMNNSCKAQCEECNSHDIILKLDDLSESIFDSFGSLGLIVWYNVKPLEKFSTIRLADELLLRLLICLIKGLKGIQNSQNLLAKLASVLPGKEVLYQFLDVSNHMEAALLIICICIHKEYAKKYLNCVGLYELDSLMDHLYLKTPNSIFNRAIKVCGFTSLLRKCAVTMNH